jgi:CheY-like chemotaxis protein/anti-sigma regulatory factor (Ser/Thr protein kinase)
MTSVLVVDDSEFDRHLAGELLRRTGHFTVAYACDGAEALESIRAHPPDLIIADLQMPGMDGLELVTAVRDLHPGVPLVLMTGHGSEQIAVRALHRGAASYVPKRDLAAQLQRTAASVLDVARRDRARSHVFEWMTSSDALFVVDNDRRVIAPLVDHLIDDLRRTLQWDETRLLQVGVALREALSNAIYHGNLEVPTELRDTPDDAFERVARVRRNQHPYSERKVSVRASQQRAESRYTVTDDGSGFDPSTLPDPLDPSSLERAGGRGLLLIRSFLDEVSHNAKGNEITMVARTRRA